MMLLNQLKIKSNITVNIWLLLPFTICIMVLTSLTLNLYSQSNDVLKKLKGFDGYMGKIIKDWNIAGAGVGLVYKDKLIFAKGYGYRDYGQKLPVTPNTLFQIASNTKLFTAISVGLLVNQGKLNWDLPIRKYVPSIEFYNDDLNNSVTIRDMLSHRTGISRHDMIWYKSDFSRKELFERLKYLEPSQPLRQGFLYNNLMYTATGYIVELLSSKTWEDFVKENIFNPLEMKNTVFTVKEMEENTDHGVPYNEKRDTTILYRIPIYEDQQAIGPAGSIISNIEDMSNWLIALINNGRFNSKQIIPANIIQATLEPTLARSNSMLENQGYKEIINPVYGMGRYIISYRGHYMTYHGGALPGFYSQVSVMPNDSFGIVVFVIGQQGARLSNIVTYNIYERLLGLDQTPWSERMLKDNKEEKKINKQARSKAGLDRIIGTKPSHPLISYTGQYENPAYGIINISLKDTTLQINFHKMTIPLKHYHYDRFDTPNDEDMDLLSLNFTTNFQGSIDGFFVSIDETQTRFSLKTDSLLSNPNILSKYVGKYAIAGDFKNVEFINNSLYLVISGYPSHQLIPIKPNMFRIKELPDNTIEFVVENGKVKAFIQIDPSGAYKVDKQH